MGLVNRRIGEIKRIEEISVCLFNHELHFLINALELNLSLGTKKYLEKKPQKSIEIQAKLFREVFEELGGAFLKLGQMLSLRPDLVGKEFSKEFESLLDNIPPENFEVIQKSIDEHITGGMSIFSHFDSQPIAAGSIAQVHKAILKNGDVVAVKIQRPNIKIKFEEDIDLMLGFAHKINNKMSLPFVDFVEIVEEFKRYTLRELDFNHEASNMMRFKKIFSKDSDSNIIVPKTYSEYSSSNILVMQFIEGFKISQNIKMSANQKRKIVRVITQSGFSQIFETGFFHADLHPGNILLLKNGKLAFLDYGIIGYLDTDLKNDLANLFIALVNGDLDKTTDALLDLNINNSLPDKQALKEGIYYTLGDYYNSSLNEMPFGEVFYNLIETAIRSKIKMPSQLIMFSKMMITMEGFCRRLYPEFNIVEAGKPYAAKLLMKKMNPKNIIREGIRNAVAMKNILFKIPIYIKEFSGEMKIIEKSISDMDERFQSFQNQMLKMTKVIFYGILFIALIINSALLFNMEPKYFNISIFSIIGYSISFLLVLIVIYVLREK